MVSIDDIAQIVLGLSAAAIFIGAMFIMAPTGNMSKSVRYVFTLAFFCSCIALFMGMGDIELDFALTSDNTDYTAARSLTETQAEYICAAALRDNNISFDKISVSTDIDGEGGIFISSIEVLSSDEGALIKKIINETVLTKEVTVR